MKKYDIVNILGKSRKHPRYLEICTPTTGMCFEGVDHAIFVSRQRLIYRCPEAFTDGAEMTFRTSGLTSHELIRVLLTIQPDSGCYDVILVDSWHTYSASIIDLYGALTLLRPGGIIVVHDCNPIDPAIVGEDYQPGQWCGATYRAFIDFVQSIKAPGYCVVDTDYGCGIVYTESPNLSLELPTTPLGHDKVLEWVVAREAAINLYEFFDRNRNMLLNIISPATFAAAYGNAFVDDTVAISNLVLNPFWNPFMDFWRKGGEVDVRPIEILSDGTSFSNDIENPDSRRGILLQAPSMDPGAELDAMWSAPRDCNAKSYGPTFSIIPGQTYGAQLYVLPHSGALQLIVLFLDLNGQIVESPRAAVQGRAQQAKQAAELKWQWLTVFAEAPPNAGFAAILIRMINVSPDSDRPAALVTRARFWQKEVEHGEKVSFEKNFRVMTDESLSKPGSVNE